MYLSLESHFFVENSSIRGFTISTYSFVFILIDFSNEPALNAIYSSSNNALSTIMGILKSKPKGGMAPGTKPVNSSNSSVEAKRNFLVLRTCFNRAESIFLSAGRTAITNSGFAFITIAFAPIFNGSPRCNADSCEV